MIVRVFMDEAGMVWVANAQGTILSEGFFKAEDETEDELRHMGYQQLITAYPTAQMILGTGIEPHEVGEIFLESASWDGAGPPAEPRQDV